jgi:Na+/phosphate symporter
MQQKIEEEAIDETSIVNRCTNEIRKYLKQSIRVYNRTIDGLTTENRRMLKEVNNEVEALNMEAKKLKYNVFSVLKQLEANSIETGHYYVQVIDYLRELAHSLEFVSRPSLQHIENQHRGLTREQQAELNELSNKLSDLFDDILMMIKQNDYTGVPEAINKQQDILEDLNKIRKKQVKTHQQGKQASRIAGLLRLTQRDTRSYCCIRSNILKAQRDFFFIIID